VEDPSDPAFPEMVDVENRAYEYAPASEPTLTTHSEVIKAIKGLKVGKSPGPKNTPNIVLRHLPKRAINFSRTCSTRSYAGSTFRQYGSTLACYLF
jgi:hypothetical protein